MPGKTTIAEYPLISRIILTGTGLIHTLFHSIQLILAKGNIMKNHENKKRRMKDSGYTRRDFIKLTKNMAVGSIVVGTVPGMACINNTMLIIPASGGYLLVDTKKCQGCYSCMLACSLVHEGKENLSLARIQVIQDPFEGFPDDLTLEQCRQCAEPECVEVCPSGALHVDTENKNIRRVDK